jgi:hypothetical protein
VNVSWLCCQYSWVALEQTAWLRETRLASSICLSGALAKRLLTGWARHCGNLRGLRLTAPVIKKNDERFLKEVKLNFN